MSATVSLCLIVKNEEARLAACLRSAASLCDEVIVVDTGSTDRTKQIAAGFGARIIDFPWCDDFSRARNEALRQASSDWIFWLDADDRLDVENREKLERLLARLPEENVAYIMRCVSLAADGRTVLSFVDHPRLFRKRSWVEWKYRVHEQILPSILRGGARLQQVDIRIRHEGYQDPAVRRRKDERNLRLLRLDAEEYPEDHAVLFHLGMTLVVLGQAAKAIGPLRQSLTLAHPQDPTIRKTYALLTQAHRRLDQIDEALATCAEGRQRFADDTELLFQEAVLRILRRDLSGGERCLRQLLTTPPGNYIAVSVDPELRGAKARFNLAVVLRDQGRLAEAEAEFLQVLSDKPEFTEAYSGLADLYLAQGRREEAAALLRRLEADPARAAEAHSIEARLLVAAADFAGARRALEKAVAAAPDSVAPRLALVQVLLADGRDVAAAEKVIQDILTLEPNNSQARLYLETIQRRLRSAGRPRVSLNVIVKNDEAGLEACLKSVEGLFDEVIVVDTGSTDRTREVAAARGARVFDFRWRDDFAAARNEALRHSGGDWVFWMDADEWLDEDSRQRLHSLFFSLKGENVAYAMQQRSVRQAPLPGAPGGDVSVDQVRLFPRLPGVAWEHRVYEQVLPAVLSLGGQLRRVEVAIQHGGYQDAAEHRGKVERNLRLAQLEYAERPDHPYLLFQLGLFQQQLGRNAESVAFLRAGVGRCPPSANYAAKMHGLLAQGLQRLGQRDEALAACRRGRAKHPADAELACLEASLLTEMGDLQGAVGCLQQLVPSPDGPARLAADATQRGWAHHQLALVARQAGQPALAEGHWKAAVAAQPGLAVAWLELAELYMAQQRWHDVEAIARQVEGPLGRPDDAAVLRSRVLLFRKDYPAARALLQEAVSRFPQSLRPRLALSHVLLFEGKDLGAAEQALRAVLALDPGNANARGNLETLLRRQGRVGSR
jgi:glycosyltransferase involved in cell wall biosynthesis